MMQQVIHEMAQYALPATVSLAVLVIVLFLFRRKIRITWLNIKTRMRLNRLGLQQICNYQFPDGMGHYFTVDRLLMRPDGISLLVYKQFPGSIFCADHLTEWVQMLGGKSYRFKNPLVNLDYQIKAISACIPDVPVNGYVFFDYQARFPKGCPDRVIRLDNIPQSLKRDKKNKAQASVVAAWEHLKGVRALYNSTTKE
jgi:hypothetical protein